MRIAFLGTAGIPNRYGGFESFLEHCAPVIAQAGHSVAVTCDARLYPDRAPEFRGVRRLFIETPANGGWSIVHDFIAFARTFRHSTHLVLLGVSGGLWFPLFRLLCALTGKRLIVNIDGVEWRRSKFGPAKRALLWLLDTLAQTFAHVVIYDSEGLHKYLRPLAVGKSRCIAYPGDHAYRLPGRRKIAGSALTICRIEPENNLELMIAGFLASHLSRYTIIGNWSHSTYAKALRERFAHEPRLQLLDPIYDATELAEHRESCCTYVHGHSVGGTNPSLVEMIFYDCDILCLDVTFNRHTASDCAQYFTTAQSLTALLDSPSPARRPREVLRSRYSADGIATSYIAALRS